MRFSRVAWVWSAVTAAGLPGQQPHHHQGTAECDRRRQDQGLRRCRSEPDLPGQRPEDGDSAGSILTGGLNRDAGENVGVYGINQGGLVLTSGNHDLAYQG